jgi:LacI family transcriptional regulator
LILCNTERRSELERFYLESLSTLHVPVAIVAPNSESSADALREFSELARVVTVDRILEGLDLPGITVNNYLGGRLVVQHLVELGHRRIACASGPSGASTARDRLRGYRDVMAEHDLSPQILSGGFTTKDGLRAARQFIRLANRPTAVACANDLCALAFIDEIARHGLRVPDDVSVTGYDDLEFTAFIRPALTSVHQPARRLGAMAVKLALEPTAAGAPMILRPRLVERQSTSIPG